MENIFENAKFGDKFIMRDGRMAIYQETIDDTYLLFTENLRTGCENNGRNSTHGHQYDIIGKWEEPINEEELNRLAEKYTAEECAFDNEWVDSCEAFKACYRKAMEE